MRRDLDVVRFCHAGYLLRLQNAADAGERGLEDGGSLLSEQIGELVLGGQALAGGYGNGGVVGDAGHLASVLRRDGFFEPERIVWFQSLG